jgi:hypothetical protein
MGSRGAHSDVTAAAGDKPLGSFTTMPATVEAMYQPDVRDHTARIVITVAK